MVMLGLYGGYVGIREKSMEATMYCVVRVKGVFGDHPKHLPSKSRPYTLDVEPSL